MCCKVSDCLRCGIVLEDMVIGLFVAFLYCVHSTVFLKFFFRVLYCISYPFGYSFKKRKFSASGDFDPRPPTATLWTLLVDANFHVPLSKLFYCLRRC